MFRQNSSPFWFYKKQMIRPIITELLLLSSVQNQNNVGIYYTYTKGLYCDDKPIFYSIDMLMRQKFWFPIPLVFNLLGIPAHSVVHMGKYCNSVTNMWNNLRIIVFRYSTTIQSAAHLFQIQKFSFYSISNKLISAACILKSL